MTTDNAILVPAQEDMVETATLLGAGAILAALVTWNTIKGNKQETVRQQKIQVEETIKDQQHDFAVNLEKTFHNPQWREAHPMKTGTVSAHGIIGLLSKNGQYSPSIIAAVDQDAHTISTLAKTAIAALKAFHAEGEDIQSKVMDILGDGEMDHVNAAIDYFNERMKAVKKPSELAQLHCPVLLGGYTYSPVDAWTKHGKFGTNEQHTHAGEIPAMTKNQLNQAIDILRRYVASSWTGNTLDDLQEEATANVGRHRGFDRVFIEYLTDEQVKQWYRTFGWEGEDHEYDPNEYNSYSAIVQDYVIKYLQQFYRELQALALWAERSVEMSPTKEAIDNSRQIATLESAISLLEASTGNLSPVQLHSLNIVASDYGIALGHKQAGLTLEAWNGDRRRQMQSLTLEAFKETLAKVTPEPAAEPTSEPA